MIKVPLYSSDGEKLKDLTVSVKGPYSKLNPKLIAQALYVEQSRLTSKPGVAKTRAEVSGGGRKPHRQKGTGKARAGSTRSPLWRGGGVTFAPRKDKKTLVLPDKMRQAASLSMWVENLKNHRVAVIDKISVKSEKTKDASRVAQKIAPRDLIILLTEEDKKTVGRAWRNLAQVELLSPPELTLGCLAAKRFFILSQKAFANLKSRLEK